MCETVGVRAGFDDGSVKGEPVGDSRAEPQICERFVHRTLSPDAMAALFSSSRSVRTWNSSSAPLRGAQRRDLTAFLDGWDAAARGAARAAAGDRNCARRVARRPGPHLP